MSSGRDAFQKGFLALLASDSNPEARSLFAYLRRMLNQHGLHEYEAKDILSEVWLRTISKFESGQVTHIEICGAWTRRVAFNYINELSRDEAKRKKPVRELNRRHTGLNQEGLLTDFLIESGVVSQDNGSGIEDEADENLRTISFAFERLSKDDRQILYLQFVDGLSFKQISERLSSEGRRTSSEAALRQRSSRARKKLRRIFHQLRWPEPIS
ncbi:RNA polymerase sigma factor [Leptolyngbya sp. FACHB-261]|uniref:RNA polymerase sigma factor n=1 Tax=Leptolyngbya sp. FACHB-261 TaxID=2692806 RepID=UPI001686F2FA|nr:sigma-70 family RNA polymerase sigma factor [Leptolyngbya sp. FACHB-261]MBD2105318.1 sigma-70 family RNA polymerase sigma factor [Leptolyngbya sp. FACHB-261]